MAPAFSSMIHLDLIFVYGAGLKWFGLLLFLVHVDVWFFQHVSVEGLSFPYRIILMSLLKSTGNIFVGLFLFNDHQGR